MVKVFPIKTKSFMQAPYAGPLSGCLVTKNATQAFTNATITWQTETYDNGNWFGTDTTTFIPPVGTEFVRCVSAISSTAEVLVSLSARKNGADMLGQGVRVGRQQGATLMGSVSAILPVVGTDTFTLFGGGGASTFAVDPRGFASFEAIDGHLKKCLIYLDSNETVGGTSQVPLLHASKVYDYGGWWHGGYQFVVPRGVKRVRVTGNVGLNAAGPIDCYVFKNGYFVSGSPVEAVRSAGNNPAIVNIVSSILEVLPGDILSFATNSAATLLGAVNYMWLQIEEVPLNFDYCLLRKTATQQLDGIVTYTRDGLIKDTAGIYRPDTDQSRLYVPRGYKYGRISWGLPLLTNGTLTNYYVSGPQDQSGSLFVGGCWQNSRGDGVGVTDRNQCGMTAWFPVTADTFYNLTNDTGGATLCTIAANESSYFQLELRKE